ncbi:hypothetical protein [Leptospira borgpetersenii]|uniref:Uncharacterized protein n=3 Tax=Leptospira TaxID=171 RepID=Q04VW9_LEPBJ|nr:hypothetical protein [Leptospira borgpetersenii]ABJ74951.1 Hypothetical protein LBJ_0211 [Leptospira borgpetersenii serovar Hardjo-bovis str. JB197]ABJ80193.1 Hypothetical protein LBL_2871 [Leptospira borgpetersenii serovar Hardjo-bovis str. L550]AMX59660.1 hypothetical protein LBK6_15440 [Leptospira borgpetersenii serovar Hardjo]AMX62888.1 hypothetical protein LBK9_15355 [Leptospira borgpetersenii serovar Hardjo]AMX66131.1 hypothetical protein LBK30_15355 [Leptospira borgpetersenii serovar
MKKLKTSTYYRIPSFRFADLRISATTAFTSLTSFAFTFFLLFLNVSIPSQKTPKEPTLPVEPTVNSDSRNQRGESIKQAGTGVDEKGEKKVKVIFCDGRDVEGFWKNPPFEFKFQHKKNNITYSKSLKIDDISKIKITGWKLKSSNKRKEGIPYRAEPYQIQIISLSGEIFFKEPSPKGEIQQISFSNQFGDTTLFLYWNDLKYENGQWFSGLKPFLGEFREDCHPDVVREIQFPVVN